MTADGVLSPQDVEGQSGSSPAGEPGSMSEAAKPATRHSKKKAKQSTRSRTAFSLEQQDKLEMAYHINPYPDGFVRQQVSQEVGLPESRIQVQCTEFIYTITVLMYITPYGQISCTYILSFSIGNVSLHDKQVN